MTHDSIGLGEDGPTHQAIEKFMLCRITPNILFLRPGDGVEVQVKYIYVHLNLQILMINTDCSIICPCD